MNLQELIFTDLYSVTMYLKKNIGSRDQTKYMLNLEGPILKSI